VQGDVDEAVHAMTHWTGARHVVDVDAGALVAQFGPKWGLETARKVHAALLMSPSPSNVALVVRGVHGLDTSHLDGLGALQPLMDKGKELAHDYVTGESASASGMAVLFAAHDKEGWLADRTC
jgi:hypothetical protein